MSVESASGCRVIAIFAAVAVLGLFFPAWRWLAADAVVEQDPARALEWVANHPRALELAAVRAYADGELWTAEELAKAAIASRPLASRPYRVLAAIYESNGRLAEAHASHQAAIAVAPSDAVSQLWLASRWLAEGNYDDALERIDRALRARPDFAQTAFQMLTAGLGDASFVEALISRLALQPPWRAGFLEQALRTSAAHEAASSLVEMLARRAGLSDRELRFWFDVLEERQRWGDIRRLWQDIIIGQSDSAASMLYDGGFERDPHQFGLGWRVSRIAGARIGFAPARGSAHSGRALTIRFLDQRVAFRHVEQRLLLAEGSYRLTGEARLDRLRTRRGLVWEIRCEEQNERLAQGPRMQGSLDWHRWEFVFTIPEGCPTQRLTLRLDAVGLSEEWIGGVAAFDGLSIERLDSDSMVDARALTERATD